MNRLQQELQRLFGTSPGGAAHPRAALLELGRPADWPALGAVWRGVQSDLGLPAPAIAVSGRDSFQLWFALADASLAEPAANLLHALCRVYLPGLKAARLRLWPDPASTAAPALPPQWAAAEQWSAFVAPDLAPVFNEEPWLDTEPGPEAQAEVLSRLACITTAQLSAALEQLSASGLPQSSATEPSPALAPAASATAPLAAAHAAPETDPRRFLLRVMNDEALAMPLRIEAAKALLGAAPARPLA